MSLLILSSVGGAGAEVDGFGLAEVVTCLSALGGLGSFTGGSVFSLVDGFGYGSAVRSIVSPS